MTATTPNPRAFPSAAIHDNHGGMTLRDWFAGQALPSVIAAYVEANGRCIGTDHVAYNGAAHAYRLADAMLAERAKVPE